MSKLDKQIQIYMDNYYSRQELSNEAKTQDKIAFGIFGFSLGLIFAMYIINLCL